jgi:hypothetical protein
VYNGFQEVRGWTPHPKREIKMTNFNKDNFNWDGMYLTYTGDQGDSGYYYIDGPNVHPTRVGTAHSLFIARFKWGSKPWKTWVNFIVKNFTVEEFAFAANDKDMDPMKLMSSKGFIHGTERKLMKEFGLKVTFSNVATAWDMFHKQQAAYRDAA